MIKLVAFDWNGTIFSDTRALLDSVNKVLKLFKLKPVSLETFQKHFDVPVTKTYIGLGIPKEIIKNRSVEITRAFHSNYEERASMVRTRAFAKQLLKWLSENNISSIIFSNHIDEPIKRQLKRLKIETYFSKVLANSEMDSSLKGRNKQDKLKDYIKNNNLLIT
ncbi:MAG: HAD hydrolase-like protein, partial [Candidatus Daviesbacteria bacterium]|nr:HAD hydrolase-like protein [Candidatus Daviesbacteria bacterium]